MIPITESVVAEHFDELGHATKNAISFLDAVESSVVWSAWAHPAARGLYDLNGEFWANSCEWISVGRWLEPYNDAMDADGVAEAIFQATRWKSDEKLLFIQGRQSMIQLPCETIRHCWRNLLSAYDDGPFLVPADLSRKEAICFAPIGEILFAHVP
jgi:hypothetical protein